MFRLRSASALTENWSSCVWPQKMSDCDSSNLSGRIRKKHTGNYMRGKAIDARHISFSSVMLFGIPSGLTFGKLAEVGQQSAHRYGAQNSQRFVGFSIGLLPSQPLTTWPIIQTEYCQINWNGVTSMHRTSVPRIFCILKFISKEPQHSRNVWFGWVDVSEVVRPLHSLRKGNGKPALSIAYLYPADKLISARAK